MDNIVTVVLTGKEKDELADKMEEVYLREFGETEGHYVRDGRNLRTAGAVVLILSLIHILWRYILNND